MKSVISTTHFPAILSMLYIGDMFGTLQTCWSRLANVWKTCGRSHHSLNGFELPSCCRFTVYCIIRYCSISRLVNWLRAWYTFISIVTEYNWRRHQYVLKTPSKRLSIFYGITWLTSGYCSRHLGGQVFFKRNFCVWIFQPKLSKYQVISIFYEWGIRPSKDRTSVTMNDTLFSCLSLEILIWKV